MLPLRSNALIRRGMWLTFRPGKFAAGAITVAAMLATALLFIVVEQRSDFSEIDWSRVCKYFGTVVMVIQIVAAIYGAFGIALSAVVEEKLRKTYEFLVTLPIGPAGKTIGLALGSTMPVLAVLVALTPLGFLCAWAGGAEAGRLLWFYAILFAGYLAVSLLGVALGHGLAGGVPGWVLMVVLFGAGLGLRDAMSDRNGRDFRATPLLTCAPFAVLDFSLRPVDELPPVLQPGGCHFYGWTVPWQIVPLAFEAYLAVLAFALACRGLSRPSGPPLPRTAVLWAMVVFQILLIGFLSDFLAGARGVQDVQALALVLQVVYFLIVLMWGMMSQPDYAGLMQWGGKTPRGILAKLLADFRSAQAPNLLSMCSLWAICAAGLLTMLNLYGRSTPVLPGIISCAVILLYLVMYQLLVVLMGLSVRRGEKILGFLLVVACAAVPGIFSTLPGLDFVRLATPGDMFAATLEVWFRDGSIAQYDWWLKSAGPSMGFAGAGIAIFGYLCYWRLGIMRQKLPTVTPREPAAVE